MVRFAEIPNSDVARCSGTPQRNSARSFAREYRVYTRKDLGRIPQLAGLSEERGLAMPAVSAVLPFRVHEYVIDELIDGSNIADDPIFQLTFPEPEMLSARNRTRMVDLVRQGAAAEEVWRAVRLCRAKRGKS